MSYKAPNPYVESVPFKGNASTAISNSIMGMIGITPNGDTEKAILVTSWSEFIEKFALGVETPFMANSVLPHAVYGFFQNGGSQLYIARVVGGSAKPSKGTLDDALEFSAKNAGEWGNKIKVEITAHASEANTFLVNVSYNEQLVESLTVNNDNQTSRYFDEVINTYSSYINVKPVDGKSYAIVAGTITLTEGADDLTSIASATYSDSLTKFDKVSNLAALSIPGQTDTELITKLLKYTEGKTVLPVTDFPEATTITSILPFAQNAGIKGKDVAIYGPYISVTDPLSATSKTKNVPCVGHIMGVMARTIDTQGEWNAPAGTDAVIKGALGVATDFTDEDRGKLNEAGVNVVLTKPNYGTVIWGARSQSADPELKYVSNLTLNHSLRRTIYEAMQRFEFKNNGPSLWVDITSEITGLLETKRLAGAFAGATPETCYYVKCDSTNNTKATIDKGQVIVEVGYAANKPAEFIIVRVAHQISN